MLFPDESVRMCGPLFRAEHAAKRGSDAKIPRSHDSTPSRRMLAVVGAYAKACRSLLSNGSTGSVEQDNGRCFQTPRRCEAADAGIAMCGRNASSIRSAAARLIADPLARSEPRPFQAILPRPRPWPPLTRQPRERKRFVPEKKRTYLEILPVHSCVAVSKLNAMPSRAGKCRREWNEERCHKAQATSEFGATTALAAVHLQNMPCDLQLGG